MSDAPSGWLPFVVTTLGAGGAGSLITTLGSQSRERRRVRSEALECLQRTETTRMAQPLSGEPYYDADRFAELQTKCLLAGVPRHVVTLYDDFASTAANRPLDLSQPVHIASTQTIGRLLIVKLIERVASIIIEFFWHPWLSRIFFSRKLRRIEQIFNEAFPNAPLQLDLETVYTTWQEIAPETRAQAENATSGERSSDPD